MKSYHSYILISFLFTSMVLSQQPLYRDSSKSIDVRIEDLLNRMTLAEKVGQMNMPCVYVHDLGKDIESKFDGCRKFAEGKLIKGIGPAGGFFTLANTILHKGARQQAEFFNELQKIAIEQTRLGIPLMQIEEGTHGLMCSGATIFPEGLTLGSTWNMDLIRDVYAVAAKEARAVGIHQLFTLVIEPNRDPRLGRNQEGYSEDPFLCSMIAMAIVEGAQGKNISAPDKVVAGLCHYPGQSQPVGGLEQGAMEISERMLREVFLPPWEAGIKDAGALGVMATYPSIDGKPAHGSVKLLTTILRDELGFQGCVLSEGGGFRHGLIGRKVVATQQQAGVLAINAGVDISITYEDAYLMPLIDNVRQGKISMELIDRAVRRILSIKFKLDLFENPYIDPAQAAAVSHSKDHQRLALQAAREGIVLLKNDKNLLPLHRDLKSFAVIGPNADNERNQLGDYTSNVILQDIVTVLDGMQQKVSPETSIEYVKGCHVLRTDWDEIDRARDVAQHADVAIIVVGENERFAPDGTGTNGEHKDVASLDLTGLQQDLVKAVYGTGTPVVVVLINGRPLSIRWIAENIPAIVEAWLPGEQGGHAVADVLFGDYNPNGRLPITIPRHVGQLPMYYNYMPSRQQTAERNGVGYVDMRHDPLFEFGFGLSYTTFEYHHLTLSAQQIHASDSIEIRVDVTNTGQMEGAEVVQLYLNDVISSVTTPIRELKGFRKVLLAPGEKKTVQFYLTPRDMSFVNHNMESIIEPGQFDVLIGHSCDDIRLMNRFEVIGD